VAHALLRAASPLLATHGFALLITNSAIGSILEQLLVLLNVARCIGVVPPAAEATFVLCTSSGLQDVFGAMKSTVADGFLAGAWRRWGGMA
jgi:hypothetical protein